MLRKKYAFLDLQNMLTVLQRQKQGKGNHPYRGHVHKPCVDHLYLSKVKKKRYFINVTNLNISCIMVTLGLEVSALLDSTYYLHEYYLDIV